MNYQIIRLFPREQASAVVRELEQGVFADGKLTASGGAKDVKFNLQLKREGRECSDLEKRVFTAFQHSPEFQSFALPKRAVPPIFSRYDPGPDGAGESVPNRKVA